MTNSYCPYSKFSVGAAILAEDGKIFKGANFENAAFSETTHAERVAITKAYSEGYRKFKAIAIIGKGEGYEPEVVTPCGSCRQIIHEIAQISGNDIEVIMSSPDKKRIIIAKISELLPLGFKLKNKEL